LQPEECALYDYPHAFINKANEPIVIKGLDPNWHAPLIGMYLAFEPKASFSGLPPAAPEACTTWVEGMIAEGIDLVALAFDQGVVGHAGIFPAERRTCEMLVVVLPAKQNIGIGTELVRCSIHLSHALGFEHIWASVERKNSRIRHVLKKCGFACQTPGQSDEVTMALDLQEYHNPARAKVREVMDPHVLTIHKDWSCRDAIEIFLMHPVGSLPVIDDRNEVVGILSQTDLLVPGNIDKRVGDVRTRKVIAVQEDSPLAEVIHLFRAKKVWCIPVLDRDKKLVGSVTRKNILAYYADRDTPGKS